MKFADIPYTPNVPPDVYERAKKWLVDNRQDFSANGNFSIWSQDGAVRRFLGMACHNGISNPSVSNRCLVATEIGLYRRDRLKKENILFFLNWLLYESKYSRFILNRNDLEFVKEYGILVSADLSTPVLQNIMILSRHFHEVHERAFDKFAELVKSGIPATIAYPVCFNTFWSYETTQENHPVRSCSGHRAHALFNLQAWKNWHADEVGTKFTPSLTDPKAHYRNDSNFYGGVFLWHDKSVTVDSYAYDQGRFHFIYELMADNETFRKELSNYRKALTATEVYHPPNPFKKDSFVPATQPDQVTYKELFDFVVPWCYQNGVLFNDVEEQNVKEVVNG